MARHQHRHPFLPERTGTTTPVVSELVFESTEPFFKPAMLWLCAPLRRSCGRERGAGNASGFILVPLSLCLQEFLAVTD